MNVNKSVITASIDQSSTVSASGAVNVLAQDATTIGIGAGGLGLGGQAGGAALTANVVKNSVIASIDSSSVTSTGSDVTVRADSSSNIIAIALGVAVGYTGGFAFGGSVVVNLVLNTIQASINSSTVNGFGSVAVRAFDDSEIDVGAGGIAFSTGNSGGATLGTNNILNVVSAKVTSSTLTAGAGGVEVKANSTSSIVSVAIAGSGGGQIGVGGVIIVNTIQKTIEASISSNSNVTSIGTVSVLANGFATSISLSGGVGIGGNVGVGAALVSYVIADSVKAFISDSNVTSSAGDVTVRAYGKYSIISVTIAGAGSSTIAVSGSIAVHVAQYNLEAYISGSGKTIQAYGNVVVEAHDELTMGMGAGSVSISMGTAGVGLANITAVVNASTKAWIGAGVIVTAFANAAAASIYSGLSDRSNNPLMDATFKGVAVTATSREDVTGVSVAGAGGSTGGGAGSASATQYDRTTSAIIYKNAQINTLTTLPAGAVAINPVIGALQSVRVLASSLSNLTLGAGSLAIGGTGGIGVGINAGVINKTTLAQIENGTSSSDRAVVNAARDISVEAISKQEFVVIAVAAAVSAGFSVAGSFSILNVSTSTRAVLGNFTTATAGGNVQVASADSTNVGSFSATINGIALSVSVLNKTTEALIGNSAIVNARANSANLNAPTGAFVASVADTVISSVNTSTDSLTFNGVNEFNLGDAVVYRTTGTVIDGLANNGTYYAIPVDGFTNVIKLALSADDARAGKAVDLTGAGTGTQKIEPLGKASPNISNSDVNEPGLLSKRKVVPETTSVRGVIVTATNSDTIEQLAATLSGATGVAIALSGSAATDTVTTRAAIGSSAKINTVTSSNAVSSFNTTTEAVTLTGINTFSLVLRLFIGQQALPQAV